MRQAHCCAHLNKYYMGAIFHLISNLRSLEMGGPAEHFQTKWGQAYVVGVICPPVWVRVNISAKNKRG